MTNTSDTGQDNDSDLRRKAADYLRTGSETAASKREDESLRQAKDDWEQTFNTIPDSVAILDDQHRVVRANRAMAARLGVTAEQCIGLHCYEAVHGTTQPPEFCPHARTCRDGREYTTEIHEPRLGGDFLVSTTPRFDDQGRLIGSVHVARDITGRKRAEEALRGSEERFRKVFDHAATGIAITDCAGRFVQCNAAYCRLTGYSQAELSELDFPALIHPEDREHNLGFIRQLLREELPSFEIENRYLHKGGNFVWVHKYVSLLRDDRDQPTHIVALVTDTTERKQTEDVLRFLGQRGVSDSGVGFFQELARYLAQSLNMDFVCIDRLEEGLLTAQTVAVFHNGRFEDNVSYALRDTPCGDAVGQRICCFPRNVRGLFPRDTVLQDLQAESYLGTTLWNAQGKPIGLIAVIGRQPLAETRLAESVLQVAAVRAAGELERLQAEEAMAAAKAKAEHAQAIAEQANHAKDHFLAVLSHELRTPLTPVVMGVAMLQDRADLAPDVRETLEMIGRSIAMEARLIDDLLDVSRIARGKIELHKRRVDLCSVIQQAAEVCKADIEARRLEFVLDLGPAAPYWVEADASRLQQVFWNLLKNALKFTPHDGRVGIRCRPDQDHVLVEINDSGIGIEQDALARVFNAFEQEERSLTRQFGGLGLGLAISKALVEMHGGTTEAHSEGRNQGATFRIRLPLASPVAQQEAQTPVIASPATVRPLRVLLVEDHPVTAKMMQTVLNANSHTVQWASDVASALELADKNNFDLLMSDLGLPDGSGHDLMRQLRQRGHIFPGVALSGSGQEEDIQRSREAGFAAHLTKPASREAVVEAIAAAVAG